MDSPLAQLWADITEKGNDDKNVLFTSRSTHFVSIYNTVSRRFLLVEKCYVYTIKIMKNNVYCPSNSTVWTRVQNRVLTVLGKTRGPCAKPEELKVVCPR